jgi:hypothetical protein
MPWPAAAPRRARLAVCYIHEADKPIRVKLGPEAVDFWAASQQDGYDLLVCTAAGATLAHQRVEWTKGTKAEIRITNPGSGSGTVRVVYLYVGASATVTSDPSVTVTGASVIEAQAGIDSALPVVVLGGAPPVKTSTGAEPGDRVVAVVGERLAVLLPVLLTLSAQPVQGGRELEDIAGVSVAVAAGTGESAPTTPAGWTSTADVRVVASPTRGAGILAVLSPDEAASAVLRVTVYLSGPASGSLPSRAVVAAALVSALAPLEV